MFGVDGPFSMVAFIVLITVGAGVFQAWLKSKDKVAMGEKAKARLQILEEDVAQLRDRVQVLEEIATDRDEHLRDEIKRLA